MEQGLSVKQPEEYSYE